MRLRTRIFIHKKKKIKKYFVSKSKTKKKVRCVKDVKRKIKDSKCMGHIYIDGRVKVFSCSPHDLYKCVQSLIWMHQKHSCTFID